MTTLLARLLEASPQLPHVQVSGLEEDSPVYRLHSLLKAI